MNPWTEEEELALTKSMKLERSEEPNWDRVSARFHRHLRRDEETHIVIQLSSKWFDMRRKMIKFDTYYDQVIAEQNGLEVLNESDVTFLAQEKYRSEFVKFNQTLESQNAKSVIKELIKHQFILNTPYSFNFISNFEQNDLKIVSGNREAYSVRYNGYHGVEKVSKGNIRPFPPAINSQSWVTGDVVEVFDEISWKTATVLKVLKGDRYTVRLHESNREIRAHKTNIRARLSWRDGHWIPLSKISRTNEVEPSFCNTGMPVYKDARLKKPKRASPFCASHLNAKKRKPTEKDGRQSQRHSFKKVDAFEGNKYMQASFNYSSNGYYEMAKKKRKTYGVVGCSLARISEPNESDNDQCSVGSCSVISGGYNKLSSHYDADMLSSDGESFNTSWVEHEVAMGVHSLELHAYRSTLEALYAFGPLSWEKEALLTNLRISLHISNDEHLTELRHLISSGARILD
ncbi:hypothetical protein QVD17_11815 [Tagetes erecta]|uniref:ENT domain-containing protein n=1 Tax=Tagetes erecta TaxID=13708 RepID=A0AAD8P2I7_TARER|nr:hypothetical protein QVD17_11815 [Tagetes erecta]